MGDDKPVTCSCGRCRWIPGKGWDVQRILAHKSSLPRLCENPACADRLNPNGTVTPRNEWIAEELDARAGVCCQRSMGRPKDNNDDTAARAYFMASSALRMNLGAPDPADEKLEVASDALG